MPTQKKRVMQVVVKADEKRKLEALAKRQARTMSGMIRFLIIREYEREIEAPAQSACETEPQN